MPKPQLSETTLDVNTLRPPCSPGLGERTQGGTSSLRPDRCAREPAPRQLVAARAGVPGPAAARTPSRARHQGSESRKKRAPSARPAHSKHLHTQEDERAQDARRRQRRRTAGQTAGYLTAPKTPPHRGNSPTAQVSVRERQSTAGKKPDGGEHSCGLAARAQGGRGETPGTGLTGATELGPRRARLRRLCRLTGNRQCRAPKTPQMSGSDLTHLEAPRGLSLRPSPEAPRLPPGLPSCSPFIAARSRLCWQVGRPLSCRTGLAHSQHPPSGTPMAAVVTGMAALRRFSCCEYPGAVLLCRLFSGPRAMSGLPEQPRGPAEQGYVILPPRRPPIRPRSPPTTRVCRAPAPDPLPDAALLVDTRAGEGWGWGARHRATSRPGPGPGRQHGRALRGGSAADQDAS